MNQDKEVENIFDNIRKLLFYVGHGKYNDFMSLEDVNKIQTSLENILNLESKYQKSEDENIKEAIYKKLQTYTSYSINDFLNMDIKAIEI